MHASVYAWVAEQIDRRQLAFCSALDVGAYDVNGTVRELFRKQYLGIDSRFGPGVDRVHNIEDGPVPGGFGVVVSTEMLEHSVRPWRAVRYMVDSLDLGGTLLMTCRGYDERGCWAVHDEPGDFWRFSVPGLRALCSDCGVIVQEATQDPEGPGVFLAGIKAR